jgi:hypothetical protein
LVQKKNLQAFFLIQLKTKKSNYLSIENLKWVILTLVDMILDEPIAGEYDNPRAAIGK